MDVWTIILMLGVTALWAAILTGVVLRVRVLDRRPSATEAADATV